MTGAIAAGKSEAMAALERLGVPTLSTDRVVHELLGGEEAGAAVRQRFGDDVAPGGRIDRARLGARVWAEPESREWLERLLWPMVAARTAEWRAGLAARPRPPAAAAVEVPLLFEAGMESHFDHTLAVVADDEIRGARARARGQDGSAEREARQLSQAEKAARAGFIVRNDGDLEALERALADVLATIGA